MTPSLLRQQTQSATHAVYATNQAPAIRTWSQVLVNLRSGSSRKLASLLARIEAVLKASQLVASSLLPAGPFAHSSLGR